MPQGRREERGQASRAGKGAKRKGGYQISLYSAPSCLLTAGILNNCSAELSLLCFVIYNRKSETSEPTEKTVSTVAFSI